MGAPCRPTSRHVKRHHDRRACLPTITRLFPPVPAHPTVGPSQHHMVRNESRSPIRRPARATMEWSRVTHDRRRLRLWETLRGEVGCVLQRGPSFAWLSQAVGASKQGRRRLGDLSVSVRLGQRLRRDVYGLGCTASHEFNDLGSARWLLLLFWSSPGTT